MHRRPAGQRRAGSCAARDMGALVSFCTAKLPGR
jgi:hypothetical protein